MDAETFDMDALMASFIPPGQAANAAAAAAASTNAARLEVQVTAFETIFDTGIQKVKDSLKPAAITEAVLAKLKTDEGMADIIQKAMAKVAPMLASMGASRDASIHASYASIDARLRALEGQLSDEKLSSEKRRCDADQRLLVSAESIESRLRALERRSTSAAAATSASDAAAAAAPQPSPSAGLKCPMRRATSPSPPAPSATPPPASASAGFAGFAEGTPRQPLQQAFANAQAPQTIPASGGGYSLPSMHMGGGAAAPSGGEGGTPRQPRQPLQQASANAQAPQTTPASGGGYFLPRMHMGGDAAASSGGEGGTPSTASANPVASFVTPPSKIVSGSRVPFNQNGKRQAPTTAEGGERRFTRLF